ncbi:MaoC family dehydratase N-terminal domain-containing protein [Methylobacterium sp. J-048]|uniref:MaoC/PaaZ C-terminal domain-containing protein n=1 Tax=Methylobacterium sp. J-048 TaxID=2836635 RepID=UPI001FBAB719|nr:MaoC/PaaZ C-terminal domain-containing protein [Methylobacterium sp. J-048]MCJ2055142.1 MaoC family dehydratase N-terminal domain-containing protein [Methylobacterium sp. J-048]
MPDPAVEDFSVGDVIVGEPLTVSRDAIVGFARAFDFQPFHLDEAAAEPTFVGRLIASGWHTAALGMRLLQKGPFQGGSSLGAPGIDELRWLAPVLPGDALMLTFRVVGMRDSASKPGLGFVTAEVALSNQHGATVLTQRFTFMLARRGTDPLPPRPVETGEPEPVTEPDDAEILPFLRDAEIGLVRDLGAYPFSAAAIVAFAEAYDPQAFHLDEAAARRSHFGGLCASGWHTAAAYMNRLLTTRARDAAYTATRGPVPESGPSPGFKNLRWLKPVYAGDTVRFSTRLTDKRASASRPGWGLAFARNTGVNQRGEPVFSFDSAVFHRWES